MTVGGKSIGKDAETAAAAENEASERKKAETQSLIEEGDRQIQIALAAEQAKDLQQKRAVRSRVSQQKHRIRDISFKCVMLPFAFIAALMMVALGLAAYVPGLWTLFCGRSPLLVLLESENPAWPLGVLISGTFIAFIAVFGAFAVGIFASRNKESASFIVRDREESPQ